MNLFVNSKGRGKKKYEKKRKKDQKRKRFKIWWIFMVGTLNW